MIKKIIPAFLRRKISAEIYRKYYPIWYADFMGKRKEVEKNIPIYDLQEIHIQNLKVLLNRDSLLSMLPKNAVCAEIGVDKGDFTERILSECAPLKLHLVDAWGDSLRYHDGLKEFVKRKFINEIEQKKVEMNIGFSTTVLKEFSDHYFDWVYLDTTHTYETTRDELNILRNKIKPGGIISGHDYTIGNWVGNFRYGVIEAVHEFCVHHGWELIFLTNETHQCRNFAIRKIT